MKKLTSLSVAVLAALAALPAIPAMAQDAGDDKVGQWFVGPRLGLMGTDSDRVTIRNNQLVGFEGGLDTQFGGIEAGFNFTPEWGYRVYYDIMNSSMQSGGSANGNRFGTDILYNFSENFYGGLGINATEIDDVKNRFYRVSAGYKKS